MTESDWNSCKDPGKMLELLRERGGTYERKLILFSCACVRRVWSHLTDERSRKAVEVAEAFADGLASAAVVEAASQAAWEATTTFNSPASMAALLASAGAVIPPALAAWGTASAAAGSGVEDWESRLTPWLKGYTAWDIAKAWAQGDDQEANWRRHVTAVWQGDDDLTQCQERAAQADLLRDILGPLPFRSIGLDPSWLTWSEGLVTALAKIIYEERALPAGTLENKRLLVLADAQEEAGCANAEVLDHLRGPGSHVRGCFVLDLLLNKA